MTDAARSRSLLFFIIAAIFLFVRLAILSAREPFFDELFTLWMARQPMSHIVPNLLHDSGPPLYYFMARFHSITALRLLSLMFATVQFAIVARRSLLAGAAPYEDEDGGQNRQGDRREADRGEPPGTEERHEHDDDEDRADGHRPSDAP